MRIDILTLFPEMFTGFLEGSLLGAARRDGLIDVRLVDIRDFADGPHRQVDDRPYGGGPGMLLMPGPVVSCIEATQTNGDPAGHVIMLTPGGRRLDQPLVEELASRKRLLLVCGRYEGFDARVRETVGAEEISIGDYVLSGGEVAAMVVVEAVARLIPGVLGDDQSASQDSFSGDDRLVEGPQYTRPREFRGLHVPEVLLSGDHRRIAAWRHEQALAATRRRSTVTPTPGLARRSNP
ncbi:MAG: tRNA (guanosine(37)-N1)-methyltransferase TrmD [Planctomycetota bacterium]|jgi:tRNA (guanine37-N1)-methyltransferase|nr:tRNA (guanosine(37)-N1)-methyltransferase TrmD [Pirellulales bacterium]MDA0255793.1 tRNA (guanosine(37)-N1)-methyltransferase TrmD [Planctomycetota bacterium]MDA1200170.1 tRNA (guanosine(37)-N1)-methyltransferase TrmD [Planctomycetota bacterium]